MPKKIILDDEYRAGIIREDLKADAALTPGELLVQVADDDLGPHATAAGNAEPIWCLEQIGEEPAAGVAQIDHDYAAADRARALWSNRGVRIYAWLKDGENVAAGDPLESDGAGALQKHVAQAVNEGGTATYSVLESAIVAWADEDNNNSAGTVRVRIRVRSA